MAEPTRPEVIAAEQGLNERYLGNRESDIERSKGIADVAVSTPSALITGTAPRATLSRSIVSPLVGRVGLEESDEILGRSYYIGPARDEWCSSAGEVQVVSWAARAAAPFFDPAQRVTPWGVVTGRRSFAHRGERIVDYEDESGAPPSAFPLPRADKDAVPRAPQIVRPTSASGAPLIGDMPATAAAGASAPPPPLPADAPPEPPKEGSTADAVDDHTAAPMDIAVVGDTAGGGRGPEAEGLRAGRLVMRAVREPRSGRLGSVLSTLQPDQYELVTWPDDRPLIIQGGPGTGKTIVATHRAAHLTTRPEEEGRLPSALIIGPTELWRVHVRGSLEALKAPNVDVVDLTTLLRDLARLGGRPMRHEETDRFDGAWDTGQLVHRAARAYARAAGGDVSVEGVTRALLGNHRAVAGLVREDAAARSWLRELGSWQRASELDRYLPALASIGVALHGVARRYAHVIVDEAQDVRPAEWRLIDRLLDDGATLTLVGDMNQRRCDTTYPYWTALARDLELEDGGETARPRVIERGYRSTDQILRFAAGLLPPEERNFQALRDGPEPVVQQTSANSLAMGIADLAEALAEENPNGTVAVIGPDPRAAATALRKRGWRADRGGPPSLLVHDGLRISTLTPEAARGLEFDGVLVVEPLTFPTALGRRGSLYTSLTRATRQLVVVHTKGLPKELRPSRTVRRRAAAPQNSRARS